MSGENFAKSLDNVVSLLKLLPRSRFCATIRMSLFDFAQAVSSTVYFKHIALFFTVTGIKEYHKLHCLHHLALICVKHVHSYLFCAFIDRYLRACVGFILHILF